MFEEITRKKIRFTTDKGNVSVEDLWQMPLTAKGGFDLDNVAKTIARVIRRSEVDSFVSTSKANADDILRLDVVKHIIAVKLAEVEDRRNASRNAARRTELLAALDEHETDALKKLSPDKIREELAALAA